MEDQNNTDLAVFHQICKVNEVDPKQMEEEAKKRDPEKSNDGQDAEKLIWTALDYRARSLVKEAAPDTELKGDKEEFTIDAYPAAPSFVVNDKNIRANYNEEVAGKIIDALGQVQMPVRA